MRLAGPTEDFAEWLEVGFEVGRNPALLQGAGEGGEADGGLGSGPLGLQMLPLAPASRAPSEALRACFLTLKMASHCTPRIDHPSAHTLRPALLVSRKTEPSSFEPSSYDFVSHPLAPGDPFLAALSLIIVTFSYPKCL